MADEPTPEEKALLEEVRDAYETAEDYLKPYREKCDHLYGLYRTYQAEQNALRGNPPDRDTVYRDVVSGWGAQLHIPIAFWTVETVLPRAISSRPRGFVLPEEESAEDNVDNMRFLLDRQQDQIDYELTLEETAKSGFIYGLGAQKVLWRKEYRDRRYLAPMIEGAGWTEETDSNHCSFDDWDVEDIDLSDLLWDPFGFDRKSLGWVIHRTWRRSAYVLDLIARGSWNTAQARSIEKSDLESGSGFERWDESMRSRLAAAGYSQHNRRGTEKLHEVWEFHDGQRVITVLDRQLVVQSGRNPNWHGQLPFVFFRPTTPGIKQLPGLGIIEPIEHLIREMDTLRSQRRDNAALKLMQVFAFDDGILEADDLKFFPGAAIPTNGPPRDLLMPINVGDIPHSSYAEEDRITGDVERATGISDTVTGSEGTGAAQTATGVQLVQAAANIRIQRQTRRLELETVKPTIDMAILMNQQRITGEKTVRTPAPPQPGRMGPVWQWKELSPRELAGLFTYEVEGGSMSPENVPQRRQDAQFKMTLLGQLPEIERRTLIQHVLRDLGVQHPENWLVPEAPSVPAEAIQLAAQMYGEAGQDPQAFLGLIGQAMASLAQEQEGGPESEQEPSANGGAPVAA